MIPLRIVTKSMGKMLIERHIINEEQLNQALEEFKKKGGYLSQHLIALGFATEQDIAVCLSNQYNFAYLPLKRYNISEEVLKSIPLKWIRIYMLLPVDKVGNVLSVTMADPLNEGVIQMLEQISNCDIQVFISTYSELNEAINSYFKEELKELKESYLDAEDTAKVTATSEFIQTRKYAGVERRKYIRVNIELDISYYFHAKIFMAKTKNISYTGIFFSTNNFIPFNTNLACKIYLKKEQTPIDVVITILRIQSRGMIDDKTSDESAKDSYDVAGIIDFITSEDRSLLISFLKENIK
ncbi:MAG: PilZ domain-containing protein [Candidatus Omnitrophota bacterium]